MNLSDDQVAAIRARATERPRILAVQLFGSRAKGTHRPDSDVDPALLISEDPHDAVATIWMFDLQEWAEPLHRALGPRPDRPYPYL